MGDVYVSPCLSCCRVKDPADCNNKNCLVWQQWFIERWEHLQKQFRGEMERAPQPPKGISIGGREYLPPHRTRSYLQKDPCADCLCRGPLCTTPCRVRRAWEEARNEVLL